MGGVLATPSWHGPVLLWPLLANVSLELTSRVVKIEAMHTQTKFVGEEGAPIYTLTFSLASRRCTVHAG